MKISSSFLSGFSKIHLVGLFISTVLGNTSTSTSTSASTSTSIIIPPIGNGNPPILTLTPDPSTVWTVWTVFSSFFSTGSSTNTESDIFTGILQNPINVTIQISVDTVTLVLPPNFSGPFIKAPSAKLSGTLTVDFSNFEPDFAGSLSLFDAALSGSFDYIEVIGLNTCSRGTLGKAGELYVIGTCTLNTGNVNFLF